MLKNAPHKVVHPRLTSMPTLLSMAFALIAVWPGQPRPALAAERTVLCEEFTNRL